MYLKPIPGLVLLLLIVVLPIFSHLDQLPLQMWDESRVAIKALEMSINGNWFVTTFNNTPDMWSVKPPLMVWIQVVFIKLLGPNELAVRLPSALSALATILLIYWFFAKKYKDAWIGVIAGTLLVTSYGFITLHGARTGDFDALLTLLTTGYILFFYRYIDEGRTKYLYYTFIFLILSTLTKGVQELMFMPGILIFSIYKKQLLLLLRRKEFYIGVLLFLIVVPGYYAIREHYNPGFLKAVWENELGMRFNNALEGHVGPFYYYIDWLVTRAFTQWYVVLIIIMAGAFMIKDKQQKDLLAYCGLAAGFYLLIISTAQTKCWWYIMPLVPFMAISAAIFINIIFKALFAAEGWKPYLKYNILPYAFLLIVFNQPFANIMDMTLGPPPEDKWDYINEDLAALLQNEDHHTYNISIAGCVVPDTEDDNLLWYKKVLTLEHKPVKFVSGYAFADTDKVVGYKPTTKKYIEDHYNVQVVDTFFKVNIYKLKGKKQGS